MTYYCYLLHCNDGSYYCGWTTNLQRRLSMHNSGKGAKYTRARLPVSLVFYETFQSRAEAMRREYAMKKLGHDQKKALIDQVNHDAA